MSQSRFARASIGVVIACGVAAGQSTTRVNVSTSGAQSNSGTGYPSISADGRFVAFVSDATNLVSGDTNGQWDVFVHDRTSGTTERVSVDSSGVQGNAQSGDWSSIPCMSADGRFVAYPSIATNLVAGDTNAYRDVFVRDRANGTTERVSVDSTGAEGNGESYIPSISADGRFVAFTSYASSLAAGDTNGDWDIFVRDRSSGTTELVSVATGGAQGNQGSASPSISADGRFVAFDSSAANLVVGDTNGQVDVFVRDRTSGMTERASIVMGGGQGNSLSDWPSISGDGRFVAFSSHASNFVAGDTNGADDAFVRDLYNRTTACVSVDSGGVPGNHLSDSGPISSDGRFVAFMSYATNLVAGDTNGQTDVFIRDRIGGTTERVSVDSAGVQANGQSNAAVLSSDGRYVAFVSLASNLIAGDTNGTADVFVRDRGPQPPTAYCTSGTSSHGCSASIAATANPSISHAHTCTITVTSVEGLKSGILFYGINNTGFTPGPWAPGSTSSLCAKHPTQRTLIQSSNGTLNSCDGSFVLDWNAYQSLHPLALGNPWSIDAKVYLQAWFRDPLAVKATNLSNALEMTYLP